MFPFNFCRFDLLIFCTRLQIWVSFHASLCALIVQCLRTSLNILISTMGFLIHPIWCLAKRCKHHFKQFHSIKNWVSMIFNVVFCGKKRRKKIKLCSVYFLFLSYFSLKKKNHFFLSPSYSRFSCKLTSVGFLVFENGWTPEISHPGRASFTTGCPNIYSAV